VGARQLAGSGRRVDVACRLEREPEILKTLCFRLGLIYADRLVECRWRSRRSSARSRTSPTTSKHSCASPTSRRKLASGSSPRCVRAARQERGRPDIRATHLHRVAKIFREGFGDQKRAERALNLALDGAPTNDDALQAVVQFYKDARDITSVRVHLNRVAGAMRACAEGSKDGIAYRVISRAMMARASTNLPVRGRSRARRRARRVARHRRRARAEAHPRAAHAGPVVAHEPEPTRCCSAWRPARAAPDVPAPRDRIAKHVGVDLRRTRGTR